MPRPKRGRATLVGHSMSNTFIWPETAMAQDPRLNWPTASTLAQHHLTLSAHQAIYKAQDGACAICATPREPLGLVIDHNHKTGKVRGLLCGACNTGIGLLKDSPDVLDAAIEYLEQRGCYGPDSLNEESA